MAFRATLRRSDTKAPFQEFYRGAIQVMERAALVATDRARRRALTQVRGAMQGAGLGRLGNGLGSTSDLARGRSVHRFGASGFSASGGAFIRSGSERSKGAIESYTEGATIRPKRGRWLWIPTAEAPRLAGRKRLTPELYRKAGEPLGPLVLLRSIDGRPLLAVANVGKSEAGARGGRVRSLTKAGRTRKGDRTKQLAVLFVGIPRTTRGARVNVNEIMRQAAAELPALFEQAMGARR